MSFLSPDLVPLSSLSASSTDSTGAFGVSNLRATGPGDETRHSMLWQSVADASCATQSVSIDWSSRGPQSLTSFSVLNGPQPAGPPIAVTLHYFGLFTKSVDVAPYQLCTPAQVVDGKTTVEWDICALDSNAPMGTYDGVVSATFTFQPPSNGGACQMNLYEIQVHGNPTPGVWISLGGIIGIILASLAVVACVAVLFIRQRNLQKDFMSTNGFYEMERSGRTSRAKTGRYFAQDDNWITERLAPTN